MTPAGTDEIQGCVFHIIHGSFVDGHGIRTTVFLKGCPLRCVWCCNPEGQEAQCELKVTAARCDACGACIPVCPTGAITVDPGSAGNGLAIDRSGCTNCGRCIEVCYKGALGFFGETTTVGQVFEIVARDREYYKRSGGGVTIGGGEPTLQADFTYALMRRCQESGIHVAVDTCGHTRTEKGLRILDEADLLLFDLKGMDAEEHRLNTGVSNRAILDSLMRRSERRGPIIVRLPLIPGYTDSRRNIVMAAELLSRYESVERIDLMPYHKFGTIKYEQLGKKYRLTATESPSGEHIEAIEKIFNSYGLKTQVGG